MRRVRGRVAAPAGPPVPREKEREGHMQLASVRFLFAALVLAGSACGIKAPPVPRETVVPTPVRNLAVQRTDDGVLLTFTLPATRLDGGRLKEIAGYRVLCRGPDGGRSEQEFLFSFSQRSAMVGRPVELPEALPAAPGTYRYAVVPLDRYGSHPRGERWVEFVREGPDRER